MKISFLLLFIFITYSCNQDTSTETGVQIETKGVFEPVTIKVEGGLDRGESVPGDDPDIIKVSVKNNSDFTLIDLSLLIDDENSNAGVTFTKAEGEEFPQSPGVNGTCTSNLAPGKTCLYEIEYLPTTEGFQNQIIEIVYKNLVDEVKIKKELEFLTGNAATLIFLEGTTTYSFGIIERTDRTVFTKDLVIKNTGGLFAKSINFGLIGSDNSGAYSIANSTCGKTLIPDGTCTITIAFTSKNYLENDSDENYLDDLVINYTAGPDGSLPKGLSANFDSISATIEAKMKVSGFASVEFSELVVGNFEEKSLKIRNDGYKEAILRKLHFRDDQGNHVATCVRDNSSNNLLSCRAPGSSAELALNAFPFRVVDENECFNEVSKLGYTRNSSGIISDSSLRTVAGGTIDSFGEECSIDLTFHPSITFLTDGDFNNYNIALEYDSTWKNLVYLYGDDPVGDSSTYVISKAEYLKAASVSTLSLKFDDEFYSELTVAQNANTPGTTDGVNEYFDLGRVALITSSQFKRPLEIRFRNSGSTSATLQSITDGDGFEITTTPQTIPAPSGDKHYFREIKQQNCSTMAKNSNSCKIFAELTPLASSPTTQNATMFDEDNGYPDRYKVINITYTDGTSVNDDLTPTTPRTLTIRLRAFLVAQGYLVFDDNTSGQGGRIDTVVAGTPEFYHVIIANRGTASIPYIKAVSGYNLLESNPSERETDDESGHYPFDIVDRAGAEAGADKDCYDLIDWQQNDPNDNDPITNSLDAGETCSLTVKMALRNNERATADNYGITGENILSNWFRSFNLNNNNPTEENWEWIMTSSVLKRLSFTYYDGDGVSGGDYNAEVEGYGVEKNIAGGDNGDYYVEVDFGEPAKIVPLAIAPIMVGAIRRASFDLPQVDPIGDDWGNSISSTTIGAGFDSQRGAPPAVYHARSKTRLNSNPANVFYDSANPTEEYIAYGGTYPADGSSTYSINFRLTNGGGVEATDIVVSAISGDPEITTDTSMTSFTDSLAAGATRNVNFYFTPGNSTGVFSTVFSFTYKNGQKDINDLNALTYSEVEKTFRVKVVFESLPTGNSSISVQGQDYTVTFDADTETTDEVLDGATEVLDTAIHTHSSDTSVLSAIKGSAVYAKKRYTITNTGDVDISDIKFSMKTAVQSTALQVSNSGRDFIFSDSDPGTQYCNDAGVVLSPAESCIVEIKFNPLEVTAAQTLRAVITFDQGTNQYIARAFSIYLQARDPAILDTNLTAATVTDINDFSPPDGSYRLDLKGYSNSNHVVLTENPGSNIITYSGILVNNLSDEKASFLKAYRNINGGGATIPVGEWHTVHNPDQHENVLDITVEANRACFYGDEEGGGDPNTWGFNQSTVAQCELRAHISFGEDYLGEMIDIAENIFPIEYYNNGRASSGKIYFHLTGFVEPNRTSASSAQITNVLTDSDGSIIFDFEAFTPVNSNWGNIIDYRIFFVENLNSLNNIFSDGFVNIMDVPSAGTVEITGLNSGTYYYIYIVPRRLSPEGNIYLSDATNFSPIEVIVPTTNTYYDFDRKVLVDKYLSPEGEAVYGTRDQAIAVCSQESINLRKNNSTIVRSKEMITLDIYESMRGNEELSTYPVDYLLHWMSDDRVDISGVFPDYDCSVTTDSFDSNASGSPDTFYNKSCTTCNCNDLHIFRGSDGDSYPPDTTLYVDGDDFTGGARCFVSQ